MWPSSDFQYGFRPSRSTVELVTVASSSVFTVGKITPQSQRQLSEFYRHCSKVCIVDSKQVITYDVEASNSQGCVQGRP